MKALKSTLAKTALADHTARARLRNYTATKLPTVIEVKGQRYKPEVVHRVIVGIQ